MKKIIGILFISLLLFSCNYYGDEKLGNGYYIVKFNGKATLIYSKDKPYKGEGRDIIPQEIINYKYNSNYIIVKSKNLKGQNNFWIIDKKVESKSFVQLDSFLFFQKLNELNINLKF